MDCGRAAVGIEVPQYKSFYTVPNIQTLLQVTFLVDENINQTNITQWMGSGLVERDAPVL